MRGFTLIELLVVIAVLAVIAAGVVVGINPAKRINQANDTKIRNDIGQAATAFEAYFTTNQAYPAAATVWTDIVASGDLKIKPDPPGAGTEYTYEASSTGCTPSGSLCKASLEYTLNDVVTGAEIWCWQSATGTAKAVPTTPGCAP